MTPVAESCPAAPWRVTVLGSGTGLPHPTRHSAGYLLQTPAGAALVDCGSGSTWRLVQAGVSLTDLARVFITHTHADHVGDLVALVHALRNPETRRTRDLPLYGPAGLGDFLQRVVFSWVGQPKGFSLPVHEPGEIPWDWDGIQVTALHTRHVESMASLAWRFSDGQRHVVFSGDAEFTPELAAFCTGAHLAILDASFIESTRKPGHMTAGDCGRMAAAAGVGRLLLTHFYPIPGDDAQRVDEAARHFAGPIQLAQDLGVVDVV
ncbi:MAG: MBL fold metallo-hydrolase [Magnetococcus sp. WYHC-3]